MPQTRLLPYRETDGSVPIKRWLQGDPEKHIYEEHRSGEDPQDD